MDLCPYFKRNSFATLREMYFEILELFREEGLNANPQTVSIHVNLGGNDIDVVPARSLSDGSGNAAAAVAALLVFLWVVANAQATGLVPVGLGEWTVGHVLAFFLNVILWELILVASWVTPVALAVFFLWYRKLPAEERRAFEGGPRRGRRAGANGGISFFTGLVWLLIVWTDGRWNRAFKNWTFNELVYSWIAAGLVVLLIAGVPALMYLLWSIRRSDSMRQTSSE